MPLRPSFRSIVQDLKSYNTDSTIKLLSKHIKNNLFIPSGMFYPDIVDEFNCQLRGV